MLKVTGTLLNIVDKSEFKKEDGTMVPSKAKVQVLSENIRKDGNKIKILNTISVPDEKISQYKDKISKEVSVDVGIISKEYSFYGI